MDYVGVFQNYKEALNYAPEDIGEFEDVDALLQTFPQVLDTAFEYFVDIKLEDSYDLYSPNSGYCTEWTITETILKDKINELSFSKSEFSNPTFSKSIFCFINNSDL